MFLINQSYLCITKPGHIYSQCGIEIEIYQKSNEKSITIKVKQSKRLRARLIFATKKR